jgi:predicted nucleic acid-binding protein
VTVASPYLLDTGFLVALVNQADPDHRKCVEAWGSVRAPLVTTEGVLVEAAHMLRRAREGARAAISLVRASGATVVEPSDERYERALVLMEKYRDVPMDFVDATLVALAEERRARDVLTLDHRGFTVYRFGGRGHFRIVP